MEFIKEIFKGDIKPNLLTRKRTPEGRIGSLSHSHSVMKHYKT